MHGCNTRPSRHIWVCAQVYWHKQLWEAEPWAGGEGQRTEGHTASVADINTRPGWSRPSEDGLTRFKSHTVKGVGVFVSANERQINPRERFPDPTSGGGTSRTLSPVTRVVRVESQDVIVMPSVSTRTMLSYSRQELLASLSSCEWW